MRAYTGGPRYMQTFYLRFLRNVSSYLPKLLVSLYADLLYANHFFRSLTIAYNEMHLYFCPYLSHITWNTCIKNVYRPAWLRPPPRRLGTFRRRRRWRRRRRRWRSTRRGSTRWLRSKTFSVQSGRSIYLNEKKLIGSKGTCYKTTECVTDLVCQSEMLTFGSILTI